MTNRTRWLMAIACAALLGAGIAAAQGPPAPAPSVKNRQIEQQRRIGQGVRSGELTPKEAHKLERSAARIHRSVKRDRLDGGAFTPKERAKAQHKLNRQSRKIYRDKHHNQSR